LQEVKINRRTAVLDPDFLVGWRHPTGAKLKLLFDQKSIKTAAVFLGIMSVFEQNTFEDCS